MTVANSNNRTRLAVSGLTYDFTFKIDDDSELLVYLITDDVADLQTLTTDYTVSISEISEGGTVTLTGASSADEILMVRDKDYVQGADIPARGGFNEPVIEGALDSIVMMIQQLKELIDYCVKQDSTAVQLDIVLPTPQDGYAIGWDGVNGAMQNLAVDTAALNDTLASAVAAAAAALASQTAAAVSAAAAAASAVAAAASAAQAAIDAATAHSVDKGDVAAANFTVGASPLSGNLDGSYHDMDLSSFVPAGTILVLLRVTIVCDTIDKSISFRKNGNSNTANAAMIVSQVANKTHSADLWVACDANRVIEFNAASGVTWSTVNITVGGYLKA